MLQYVGAGTWFYGVPARDLTEVEVAALPISRVALLESGLYVAVDGEPTPAPVALCGDCGQIDMSDGVNEVEATLAGRALREKRRK